MKNDFKKRSMEDLCTAVSDYSFFQSKLQESARNLRIAKARVAELEKEYSDLEAQLHKKQVMTLDIALDVKDGK